MAKKKPHKEPGRPPALIPKEQVLHLAERQWGVVAIAAFFKVEKTTIYRHVSAAELDAARQNGVAKLREALFTRAMGGRIEKKNEDGTTTISFLKSSDRLLQHALDRFEGRVKQEIEINPDPDRPANMNVTEKSVQEIMEKLEREY